MGPSSLTGLSSCAFLSRTKMAFNPHCMYSTLTIDTKLFQITIWSYCSKPFSSHTLVSNNKDFKHTWATTTSYSNFFHSKGFINWMAMCWLCSFLFLIASLIETPSLFCLIQKLTATIEGAIVWPESVGNKFTMCVLNWRNWILITAVLEVVCVMLI